MAKLVACLLLAVAWGLTVHEALIMLLAGARTDHNDDPDEQDQSAPGWQQ